MPFPPMSDFSKNSELGASLKLHLDLSSDNSEYFSQHFSPAVHDSGKVAHGGVPESSSQVGGQTCKNAVKEQLPPAKNPTFAEACFKNLASPEKAEDAVSKPAEKTEENKETEQAVEKKMEKLRKLGQCAEVDLRSAQEGFIMAKMEFDLANLRGTELASVGDSPTGSHAELVDKKTEEVKCCKEAFNKAQEEEAEQREIYIQVFGRAPLKTEDNTALNSSFNSWMVGGSSTSSEKSKSNRSSISSQNSDLDEEDVSTQQLAIMKAFKEAAKHNYTWKMT